MTRMPALLSKMGVTYRQADYWRSSGFLGADAIPAGSGYRKDVTRAQARRLAVLAELVRLGFTAAKAAEIAQVAGEDFDWAADPWIEYDVGKAGTFMLDVSKVPGWLP